LGKIYIVKHFIALMVLSFLIFSNFSFAQDNLNSRSITITKDSLNFYLSKLNKHSESISFAKTLSMRVSYIYLDGAVLKKSAIDKIRETILLEYKKNNVPFSLLANKYTMDTAKDGDLGWFEEGMMVKVFEDEIKNHKKDDIFIVDIPKNNWYYVVLKTYDDIEKIKITYITK
jgi:parvulin-like peptidyl-prolyl isomerase